MKLIQRFGYYLGGFSMGLVILAFFLNGKKASCSYGPESRVLKNINTKNIHYSQNILEFIENGTIDSTQIDAVLKKGSINFSNSNPRQEPCGTYSVEGVVNEKEITILVENCDSIATLTNIKLK